MKYFLKNFFKDFSIFKWVIEPPRTIWNENTHQEPSPFKPFTARRMDINKGGEVKERLFLNVCSSRGSQSSGTDIESVRSLVRGYAVA
jgi:hypothetical protein